MRYFGSFPVQYSTLSSCALQERILTKYPLDGMVLCEYLYRGMNDNYLIKDSSSKYIFKVYRYNWRNLEDIESEVELLQSLKSDGISVSFPIPDKEGVFIQKIYAPEGLRYAVMFSYAVGNPPLAGMTPFQSNIAGRELARIHNLTEYKRPKNRRCRLDFISLLDDSFFVIEPFIDESLEDLRNLGEVVEKLKRKINSIPLDELDFGICHGDFYPSNYHLSDKNEITIFDFDSSCCSYFIYDIASFNYSVMRFYSDAEKITGAFVEGYQEMRKLKELEIGLIPYFGAISFIWTIATQCSNFEVFSHFVRNNIKRNTIGTLKEFTDRYCV